MSVELWKGMYPALLTPFKTDGSVDFDMFKTNLDAQLEAGISGIIIGGSLGEASTLSNPEKLELVKFAKSVVSADIPVIMNIAEQVTADAVQLAKDGESAGADGFMLLPPMRYKADDRETVVYFQTVAAATSLEIMIYNNPVDYAIKVTLDMFAELAKSPNITAVKESSRDLTNVTRMKNRFGDRFKILGGVDTLILESLAVGVDGIVGGLVDAFPRETMAILKLVAANRYAEALEIYRWFMPLLELDILPKLVQYIKLAAVAEGIGNEYVRAPRLPLEGKERDEILKIIQDGIATRPDLSVLEEIAL